MIHRLLQQDYGCLYSKNSHANCTMIIILLKAAEYLKKKMCKVSVK